MNPQVIGYVILACLLGICILAVLCNHSDRKQRRGLPEPRPDERDWTAIHMRDVKRWTR